MRQIYEIRGEIKPYITHRKVQVTYCQMNLEGLLFTLSHLFGLQYILLAHKDDLKFEFENFELENEDLEVALNKITQKLPHLHWEILESMVVVYDPREIDGSHFKVPFALQIAYQEISMDGTAPVSLLRAICYMAEKYGRSISCNLDYLDTSRPVNIPLRGHKKLGQVTASILREIPNMKVDCFENVIYLENEYPSFWKN